MVNLDVFLYGSINRRNQLDASTAPALVVVYFQCFQDGFVVKSHFLPLTLSVWLRNCWGSTRFLFLIIKIEFIIIQLFCSNFNKYLTWVPNKRNQSWFIKRVPNSLRQERSVVHDNILQRLNQRPPYFWDELLADDLHRIENIFPYEINIDGFATWGSSVVLFLWCLGCVVSHVHKHSNCC